MLNPAIDSMTVLTPIDCFDWISPDFMARLITVDDSTGEEVSSAPKPVIFEQDGIKFRVMKTSVFGKEYISFTYTAKMLGERYLTAINLTTFYDIFHHWTKQFFAIDLSVYFDNSIVNDCDFKVDFVVGDDDFHDYLCNYRGISGSKVFYGQSLTILDKKHIIGIQLVNRRDASITAPFIKFYSKEFEMDGRSSVFRNAFLLSANLRDLRRMEGTVRNLEHFESLKCLPPTGEVKRNSLRSVLQYAPFAYDICCELLSRHLTTYSKPVGKKLRNESGITPAKYYIFKLMYTLIKDNSYTLENVLCLMDDNPEQSDTSRSRLRSSVIDVFNKLLPQEARKKLVLMPKDAFFP